MDGLEQSRLEVSLDKGKIHVVCGDTQIKAGVPTAHLTWIGRYIVDQFAGQDIKIVHVGDHWDMPSLSSYDKGKKAMEGRRYKSDVDSGNEAIELLNEPLDRHNASRRKSGKKQWTPGRWLLRGNHENRINVAVEADAQLDGVIGEHDLKSPGWEVVPYLEPLVLDGIHYAHFFYNPNTGRPYCGENLYTRLKTIGHSFTMGHQQGLNMAIRPVGTGFHRGLVVGSTYLHDEKYLGPQGNRYWRGIVVCHQVEDGTYDPMCVSLDFLCRKYEGRTLAEYMTEWNKRHAA